nr:MAG TPA: hypothetical protein [Caudoviricetes sp.]
MRISASLLLPLLSNIRIDTASHVQVLAQVIEQVCIRHAVEQIANRSNRTVSRSGIGVLAKIVRGKLSGSRRIGTGIRHAHQIVASVFVCVLQVSHCGISNTARLAQAFIGTTIDFSVRVNVGRAAKQTVASKSETVCALHLLGLSLNFFRVQVVHSITMVLIEVLSTGSIENAIDSSDSFSGTLLAITLDLPSLIAATTALTRAHLIALVFGKCAVTRTADIGELSRQEIAHLHRHNSISKKRYFSEKPARLKNLAIAGLV